MGQTLETVIKENGYTLHLVPSKKYKTITFVAKLKAPLTRETITGRALLPFVLRQGTKKYPTRKDLQFKLDDLYGASLTLDGSKAGNYHVMSTRMQIANQKYIQNESSIMEEALKLLYEVLFNPNIQNKSFNDQTVDREKNTLLQHIRSIKDDKTQYAQKRLVETMCEGETYQIPAHGYEEDLKALSAEDLYSTYKGMIERDDLDLYILGDFDHDKMTTKVKEIFKERRAFKPSENIRETKHIDVNEPKKLIERDDVQQAKLHIGYRTNTQFQDEHYPALVVFNGLFGGFPSSKLFVNVREKHSMAYYVGSAFASYNGLLFVNSGVGTSDYEKAQAIIDEQLEALRQGDFTDEEIAQAKAQIVNELLETMDRAQGLIELLYQSVVGGKERDIDEFIQRIQSVTREDIVRMANNIQQDTIYVLTREEDKNEEN